MRIIIIGPAYPYRGGIADTDESLCRALMEEGHEVSISTFTAQYPKLLFPGKTQFSTAPAPEGLKIERLIHSYNPLNWRKAANQIKSEKPELVIFRFWTPFMGLVYRSLAKRLHGQAKLIALVDNASPHESSFWDKRLTHSFLSKIEGVMCLSRYVEREIKEMQDVPVTSYPHPINSDLAPKMERQEALDKLGLDASKRYILFFGLIRKYKGLDILIESFALLKERMPDLRLIIAGEFYDAKDSYLDLIKSKGLIDRVIVHDQFIAKEDVSSYFSAVELLALTYRSATQSGVTQVGMRFDLPMLVTDVGALGEYVEHQVMGYVVPKEPVRIADAVEDFFLNQRYKRMSQSVAEKKSKYSWKHFAEALLRFAEKI
jgi:glycosyltransferase involved in cell wall biosynthesis